VTAIDPRTLGLIHDEIDGLNSEADSSRLRELLAEDAAAREYHARMVELLETLSGVGEVDPPEGLRRDIMRSVRDARIPTGGGARSWLRALWPGGRVVLRYGYAFAAGIILGLAGAQWYVTEMMDLRRIASSEVAGTITAPAIPTRSAVVQQRGVELEALSGTVFLLRSDGGFDLVLSLDTAGEAGPAGVSLTYNSAAASVTGFSQARGQVRDFRAADGHLSWGMRGHHELTVHFSAREETGSEIELRFLVGGAPVHTLSLGLAGSP